jgi:hypothetical protein
MALEPDGQVFERPLPVGYLPAFAFLFLPAVAAALFSGQISSTAARLAASLPWVDGWSFGWIVHGACIASAGLVYLGCLGWAGRRYGRAVITADHVIVTPLRRGVPPIVVPRDDIVALRETAFGLELTAPSARCGLRARLLPAFIPASDADLARAHEVLDPARRVARPFASASSARPALLTLAAVAAPLWLLSAVLGWSENLDPGETGVTLAAAGALLALGWIASGVERRRVHLGTETVSVGSLCGAWSSVSRVWAWGAWFALELRDGRRQHACVGTDAAARLAALARERLDALGRHDELALALATRRPAWVTRRRAALAGAVALLMSIYVAAGPVAAWTREGCLAVSDSHHGYQLRLVYRARQPTARLVVIADPGATLIEVRAGGWRSRLFEVHGRDADVRVDVAAGTVRRGTQEHAIPRDATVVHVRADGVAASTRPLPQPLTLPTGAELVPAARTESLNARLELLEAWLPDFDEPLIRGALDGRTTKRCFAINTTSGGRLFTQVDRGQVTSVALIEPSGLVLWRGVGACGGCKMAYEAPGRCLRMVDATGLRQFAPMPTLEEVLETQRLVSRGAAVEDTPVGRLPWR